MCVFFGFFAVHCETELFGSPEASSHAWVLYHFYLGGGLVEPRRADVRAPDRRITLHRRRGRQLSHRHRQVRLLLNPPRVLFFTSNLPYNTDRMCLTRHRRILKKDPPFPKDMGPLAKDLIQRLLVKDPKKRLGSGPNGAENVKKHPFYQVGLISCLQFSTIFREDLMAK